MTTKGKCDTLNRGYKVVNSKNYHLLYTYIIGYIKCYYEYKSQTKASLNANAPKPPILTDTNRRVPFLKLVL
jgi:hypothetical protein